MLQVEDAVETIPGSGETVKTRDDSTCVCITARCHDVVAACCHDPHHRKLAIGSIICGISCIGAKALINSVKAGEARDPESALDYSRKAKKCAIISIGVWVSLVVMTPVILVFFSYILTLIN